MSKILYKNCQKYLPSKSRLWGQILFWKTHQNPTLQNCQNFQELSKIVKNIGYMMPSFGGWMFLLDICCQLLEKIWTWRSFRWLTRRWPTLSTSRWLKSFVRLNFNPSHIDQWMRMSVSNSHRGQATSLWRQFPVIVKVKVWRHCSIFLALVTFILLEENGKPHHDFGERLLCLKTSSGHCESESVEEGLLHTFWGFLWALRAQGWRKYAILRISVGGKYIFYWIYAANIWDYM